MTLIKTPEKRIRTYDELISLPTFKERFDYCKVLGNVGIETFGSSRWLNQDVYSSAEWKNYRNHIIARDFGRDLALSGYELSAYITIHHLNPLTVDDILYHPEKLFDDTNVVCVSSKTHKAIHYGSYDSANLNRLVERTPNDTKLW